MKFWSINIYYKNRKWFLYIWLYYTRELIFLIILIWLNIVKSLIKILILLNNLVDISEFYARFLRNLVKLLNSEYKMKIIIKYSLIIIFQKLRYIRKSLIKFHFSFHNLFLSQWNSKIYYIKKQLSYSLSRYIRKSIINTWISRWNKFIIILI